MRSMRWRTVVRSLDVVWLEAGIVISLKTARAAYAYPLRLGERDGRGCLRQPPESDCPPVSPRALRGGCLAAVAQAAGTLGAGYAPVNRRVVESAPCVASI